MNFRTKDMRGLKRAAVINGPEDSAYLLVEFILHQLREDAHGYRHRVCDSEEDGVPRHYAKDCALSMLHEIAKFRTANPSADHIEIALEVLRLHGGFEGSTHSQLLISEETRPVSYESGLHAKGISR